MDIKAFKMDGLGNDFVIIDQRIHNLNLSKDQIIKICDRNFIGCDQLIIIQMVVLQGPVEMERDVLQTFYQKKVTKKK